MKRRCRYSAWCAYRACAGRCESGAESTGRMAVRARAEMRWPHLRVRHACDVGGVRAHAFARATVELLVAERLTYAARAPVEQLVPEVEDVHVRSLLEESGEHQAR